MMRLLGPWESCRDQTYVPAICRYEFGTKNTYTFLRNRNGNWGGDVILEGREFSSVESAKRIVDDYLIKRGYRLLTEDEFRKLSLLL